MASGLAATGSGQSSTVTAVAPISSASFASAQLQTSGSQASASAASPVMVNALATTFASSSWDEATSELDGILTDLAPDLRRRRTTDMNNL